MPVPKCNFFCKDCFPGMQLLLFSKPRFWLAWQWHFQKQRVNYLIAICIFTIENPIITTLNITMKSFLYAGFVWNNQREYFPTVTCSVAIQSWLYSPVQYVNSQLRWQLKGKHFWLKACAIKCDFFFFFLIGAMCTLYLKWQPSSLFLPHQHLISYPGWKCFCPS